MLREQAMTRRRFAVGATAAGLTAGTATTSLVWLLRRDGGRPIAFAVEHSMDVFVWMGRGAEFTVRVHQRTGGILETFEAQTADSILTLESDHVSFRRIDAPSAA